MYGVFFIYNKRKTEGINRMQDIGKALNAIMQDKNCSPIYALLFLTSNNEEGDRCGIRKFQSESKKKISRRLRHQSDF